MQGRTVLIIGIVVVFLVGFVGGVLLGRSVPADRSSEVETTTTSSAAEKSGEDPREGSTESASEEGTGKADGSAKDSSTDAGGQTISVFWVDPGQIATDPGRTFQIKAGGCDRSGKVVEDLPVTFESGDVGIARMTSKDGWVRTVSVGRTVVLARAGGKTLAVIVDVADEPPLEGLLSALLVTDGRITFSSYLDQFPLKGKTEVVAHMMRFANNANDPAEFGQKDFKLFTAMGERDPQRVKLSSWGGGQFPRNVTLWGEKDAAGALTWSFPHDPNKAFPEPQHLQYTGNGSDIKIAFDPASSSEQTDATHGSILCQ